MSPMAELNRLSSKLPGIVLEDIDKRITDWLAAGGNEDDPYIEQQLRFAKNYVNRFRGGEDH